ncbi:MAG: hypothetical protein R3C26_17470 [Calditrichia bacterium]|nr:hypothetical protein [Calditrichia bacterium]
MAVMSIRLDDQKRKALKIIASVEGKTMGNLVEDWIENYINENKERLAGLLEQDDISEVMRMSESTFAEWDNPEDEIYDHL